MIFKAFQLLKLGLDGPKQAPLKTPTLVRRHQSKFIYDHFLLDTVQHILSSDRTARFIIFVYCLIQLVLLVSIAYLGFQLHLRILSEALSTERITIYLTSLFPGLILLPFCIAPLIWPFFVISISLKTILSKDVDTTVHHLEVIRKMQRYLLNTLCDWMITQQMKSLKESIQGSLPNEVFLLIRDECMKRHMVYKDELMKSLDKKTSYSDRLWNRTMFVWSLISGVQESVGIRKLLIIQVQGLWLCVFSRDGFILTISCLIRHGMMFWISYHANKKSY